MSVDIDVKEELKNQGAEFISFVDISQLTGKQNKGYPNAILFGITLSPKYLQKITNTPGYVLQKIKNNEIEKDEFHLKEIKTDSIADHIAEYIKQKGYTAYSQSENNIYSTGFYDEKRKITPLPHKTIAVLAGLGWIGKHNLLVTKKYGSAISMCTVLTNAPLKTVLLAPSESQCGSCNICEEICHMNAIEGNSWNISISREEIVDVDKCDTCIECLVHCPWTQKYSRKNITK